MSLQAARATLGNEVHRSIKEGDGWFLEADADLNAASRNVVRAMFDEFGAAVIGDPNGKPDDLHRPLLKAWDGHAPIYNFCGSFVVPVWDDELLAPMTSRLSAVYTGIADDAPRVYAIYDRVEAIGGALLHWS